MIRLIYTSRKSSKLDDKAILEIVENARLSNELYGITGLLISTPNVFVQCLEGEKTAVDNLFAKIQYDDRHMDVHMLQYGPATERLFATWAMGFNKISEEVMDEALSVEGVLTLNELENVLESGQSFVLRLLSGLEKKNRHA